MRACLLVAPTFVAILAYTGLPCSAASLETGDGLRLELTDGGQVSGVSCGETDVPTTGLGGFFLADFADQPEPVNLVVNPGFEQGQEGWTFAGGQSLDTEVFHSGAASARLQVPGPEPGRSNLETGVRVKPLTAYRAELWVRRQNVGVCGAYISERDDANKLAGPQTQVGVAIPKTDGEWHRLRWELTTGPQTTVLSFRGDIYNSTGTLWLDDFALYEVSGNVYDPVVGGLAATEQGLSFEGTLPARGLELSATYQADGSCIRVDGEVRDSTGRDRAVGVRFALPVDLAGWTWHDDSEERRQIAEGPALLRTYTCQSGPGQCSVYPWSAVSGKQAGLSLALPLSQGPRSFILQHDQSSRQFSATFFSGLTPDSGHHPGRAPFSLVIYRHDPAWGMRSAMERYYALFAESFVKRPTFEGYLNYANLERFDPATHELVISNTHRLPDASDFGEGYVFLDHVHGCYDYRQVPYDDPQMPSDETVVSLLGEMVKEEEARPRGYVPTAETIEKIVYGRGGKISYIGDTRYWRPHEGYNHTDKAGWGLNFRVNEDPEVSEVLARKSTETAEKWAARPEYAPWGATFTADAIEGYMANRSELNYRREHFKTTLQPLTFGKETLAPAMLNTIWDFHHKCWWPLTQEHKIATYGNSNCYEQFFTMPYVDVPMTEFDWDVPHPGRLDRYLRATAYHKIWRHWHAWGKAGGYGDAEAENVHRHLDRCLAYAIYPAVYCVQMAAQNLEDYRGLYRQYVAAIEELSEAGWEPVPYAKADGGLIVERYGSYAAGELLFTLRNYTDEAVRGTLTLDRAGLGIADGVGLICRSVLPGTANFRAVDPAGLLVDVPAQGCVALWIGTPEQAARHGLRLAGRVLGKIERAFGSEVGKEPALHIAMAQAALEAAQTATMDDLPRLAAGVQEDLLSALELTSTQAPVDLAKLVFRANTAAGHVAVALAGGTALAARLCENCVRGRQTKIATVVNDITPDGPMQARVLSPWPELARASAVQVVVRDSVVGVAPDLMVPADPPGGLLPYLVVLSGEVGGKPFVVSLPFDLATGRPLQVTARPERLFRGESRDVVVRLTGHLDTEGQVTVKLGPAGLIAIEPAQFTVTVPAGETVEHAVTLNVQPATRIGEQRVPYQVTSEDARFNTSGTLSFSVGDPVPRVTVPRIDAAPVIDGTLDEAVWQRDPLIPELRKLVGGAEATEKTAVWAAHDGDNLYIAFRCAESRMDKVVAKYTDRGSPLYQDDDVEVFVSPAGASRTYQFAVNSLGTQSDNFGNGANWRAAAQRGEPEWTVELVIPISVLDTEIGRLPWGMQFGRQQKPLGETTSWTPGTAFIVKESMGEVDFE